jgi:hypothetical protein
MYACIHERLKQVGKQHVAAPKVASRFAYILASPQYSS